MIVLWEVFFFVVFVEITEKRSIWVVAFVYQFVFFFLFTL